jgi:hypothetical protein
VQVLCILESGELRQLDSNAFACDQNGGKTLQ